MSSSREVKATESRGRPAPRTVLAAVLGGLVVLFAALNTQTVTIHWIVTTTSSPLIIVVVLCGLIGFGAGLLVGRLRSRARSR